MPTFAQPLWFLALLLLPALWFLHGRSGQRASLLFSSLELFGQSGRPVRRRSGAIASTILASMALTCWVIALARPQDVVTWEEAESSGIEIMIALDVSNSMAAEDFVTAQGRTTSRLNRAKKVTHEFVRDRAGDRIGIVAFSGQPALLGPMTTQRNWLLENRLPLATVDFAQLEEGTAIGSAIASSILHLSEGYESISADKLKRSPTGNEESIAPSTLSSIAHGQPGSRIIVLITDGANNAGAIQPIEAAHIAAEFGIRIYTVAVGSPGEQVIPITVFGRRSYRRLESYEEEDLREIAAITDGQFYQASDTQSLAEAFDSIDQLEKAELETYTLSEAEDHFLLWIGLGLGSLLLLLVLRPFTDLKLPE